MSSYLKRVRKESMIIDGILAFLFVAMIIIVVTFITHQGNPNGPTYTAHVAEVIRNHDGHIVSVNADTTCGERIILHNTTNTMNLLRAGDAITVSRTRNGRNWVLIGIANPSPLQEGGNL